MGVDEIQILVDPVCQAADGLRFTFIQANEILLILHRELTTHFGAFDPSAETREGEHGVPAGKLEGLFFQYWIGLRHLWFLFRPLRASSNPLTCGGSCSCRRASLFPLGSLLLN